jgi:hypothetical protein
MLAAANRHHSEFPNWARWQDLAKSAQRLMERFGRRKISVYS